VLKTKKVERSRFKVQGSKAPVLEYCPSNVDLVAVDDERTIFQQRGWLVLRNVVSLERIKTLVTEFDETMLRFMGPREARPVPQSGHGALWQLPGQLRGTNFLTHLTEGDLAERVAGLLDTGILRLLQETLIEKPARIGGGVQWHQDYRYTGYLDPPSAVSVRLSLVESTVETGCMYVLDKTHQWGFIGSFDSFGPEVTDALDLLTPEQRDEVDARQVPLELGPGDVSIHHCLTLHASFDNKSPDHRRTIVTHLVNGETTLVPERLPTPEARAYFETNEAGQLVGESFPVLFP
jgi:hypothetical protein